MQKLLVRQLAKVDLENATGLNALLALVAHSYTEHDLKRRPRDRSTGLMAQELDELHTQLQQSMALIAQQNLRFQAALDNMAQSLCLFGRDGRLVVCNRRFFGLYRLPASYEPIGQTLADILQHSDALVTVAPAVAAQLREAHVGLAAGATLEQEWAGGQMVAIARNCIHDGGYLDSIADVTANHQATARIRHMANYDALTDLPNRALYGNAC